MEAIGAVGERADFGVQSFEAAVGDAEFDRGEDRGLVLADRAGELDERLEFGA